MYPFITLFFQFKLFLSAKNLMDIACNPHGSVAARLAYRTRARARRANRRNGTGSKAIYGGSPQHTENITVRVTGAVVLT